MWVQISAGQGPAACHWVVTQLYRIFCAEARDQDLGVTELFAVQGDEKNTLRSVLLHLEGDTTASWLSTWQGSVLWVGRSPYRPNHKRKNWFVGVSAVFEPPKNTFHPKDLRWERMRAGGPGGQHVNTSSTAVRVTHLPTGIQVKAQEERSQHRNKSLALARLLSSLQENEEKVRVAQHKELWKAHLSLTRGDAIRVYKGTSFHRIE